MINADELITKFLYAKQQNWGYIWGTAGVKWTAEKQKELERTTDQNRAQGRRYGSKWIGHVVADCSGLFHWAFKKLGGEMYHGSNTMYLKWCTDKGELKKGKRADGKELKPGTAVFVWNGTTYSHVGLYIGDDTVIEAANTQKGVTTSKASATKWTHWGELKGVEYMNTGGKPTLRKGSKGEYVTAAQTMLLQKGYDLGKWGADGDFGSQTEKAVKQFQQDHGLKADGVIGAETWEALETPGTNLYTVTIPHVTKFKAEALIKDYAGASMKEEGV